MKKLKKFVSLRTALFVLFALLALTIMGSTVEKARYSDLHVCALQLAGESSSEIRVSARDLAFREPGAVLRANVIK